MSPEPRPLPNILITGTPTTGKTTLTQSLISLASSSTPPISLKHLSMNAIIKAQGFHSGPKSKATSAFPSKPTDPSPAPIHTALDVTDDDEENLMDHLQSLIHDGYGPSGGGHIFDWHSVSGFAVRWIDLVVVLTCPDTAVLYDRLKARGYEDSKVQENLDVEIFGVLGEEAREIWGEDGGMVELKSESVEEIEENAERILAWVQQWVKDREKNEVAHG